MLIVNPDNLPFDPEDVDIKPVIPMPTTLGDSWEKIRTQLLRRSTPHMRFRATWDGVGHNDRFKLENQKELNVMIIMIRALGDNHVDWPNEYLIQLSPTDALQLPSFDNRSRGVFYGTEGKKSAYVWNLMPISKAEEGHFLGRPYQIKSSLTGLLREQHSSMDRHPACVSNITGEKVNGILTYNGDLTFFIPSIPSGEVPMRLWKNPNHNHIQGMVCNHPVKLELLPTCHTCGSEDHDVAHCLYTDHLLGAPAIPEESDNESWKSVPSLNQSRRKKRKSQKLASEVPLSVHHAYKQRGNGRPELPPPPAGKPQLTTEVERYNQKPHLNIPESTYDVLNNQSNTIMTVKKKGPAKSTPKKAKSTPKKASAGPHATQWPFGPIIGVGGAARHSWGVCHGSSRCIISAHPSSFHVPTFGNQPDPLSLSLRSTTAVVPDTSPAAKETAIENLAEKTIDDEEGPASSTLNLVTDLEGYDYTPGEPLDAASCPISIKGCVGHILSKMGKTAWIRDFKGQLTYQQERLHTL
ncbi:hypothetical protein PGTUg99_000791 [Puccinia graminis f. sp. tritici]|uniref:Uncharacterized protein n=1 Tax=Puccinia graminis f. sp. tritici TaxID=56615 RepID=A0A5B0RV07_PUCGR|nr:hypothetical protein PGTUg99_000791 [Puccinia graminis f. sp. tritici]